MIGFAPPVAWPYSAQRALQGTEMAGEPTHLPMVFPGAFSGKTALLRILANSLVLLVEGPRHEFGTPNLSD